MSLSGKVFQSDLKIDLNFLGQIRVKNIIRSIHLFRLQICVCINFVDISPSLTSTSSTTSICQDTTQTSLRGDLPHRHIPQENVTGPNILPMLQDQVSRVSK